MVSIYPVGDVMDGTVSYPLVETGYVCERDLRARDVDLYNWKGKLEIWILCLGY